MIDLHSMTTGKDALEKLREIGRERPSLKPNDMTVLAGYMSFINSQGKRVNMSRKHHRGQVGTLLSVQDGKRFFISDIYREEVDAVNNLYMNAYYGQKWPETPKRGKQDDKIPWALVAFVTGMFAGMLIAEYKEK